MFRPILMPLDGTEFSKRVIDLGVLFVKSIHARVTGFIAEPDYTLPSYGELAQSKGESMNDYAAAQRLALDGASVVDLARMAPGAPLAQRPIQ